ncbi:MAG TPA: RNA-binding transcriptional accessory protein, partial [Planctomycetaceae bacterium]|nr:RNA-binding transcriptional accessory protein [Planctomycetaceae bacterium]
NVVALLDAGNTIPFITRYRKERTGGLDEETIRQIQQRVASLRALAERRRTVLRSIAAQGRLTQELRAAIEAADTLKRIEDLYLPYKPKKRTLATVARDRGLEPLALAVWNDADWARDLEQAARALIDPEKELHSVEDVLVGVGHIIAENLAEDADVRESVRAVVWKTGRLIGSKVDGVPDEKAQPFRDYFEYKEKLGRVPPHRVLALNRGERVGALKVRLEIDQGAAREAIFAHLPGPDHSHAERLRNYALDGLNRLLLPSLEREVRRELSERAEEHATRVFARNLRSLLLQPPVRGQRVLAIDPGFRTGCKLAALDQFGNVLAHAVIYPHEGHGRRQEAKQTLARLIQQHALTVVAIGNGTACRQTEELVAELIGE